MHCVNVGYLPSLRVEGTSLLPAKPQPHSAASSLCYIVCDSEEQQLCPRGFSPLSQG